MEERKQKVIRRMGRIKHKLIVMSGKGGVGKSTVASYLAIALASRGKAVGLMDADIHGPSVPRMLGLEGHQITATADGITPIAFSRNLKVVSIGFLLGSGGAAVIWRGPLKMGLIEEFLGNVDWGSLDYLIVDSPPGTGDEPLSVCQLIPDLDGALIVATPQDIALADVEKSVTFCRKVQTPVMGIIENMSGFVCPSCGEKVDVFKSGGAERLAAKMSVPFLGRIPIVPEVVEVCDSGACSLSNMKSVAFREALESIIGRIVERAETKPGVEAMSGADVRPEDDSGRAAPKDKVAKPPGAERNTRETAVKLIALPVDGDRLSTHFGHSSRFAIYCIEGDEIAADRFVTPPPHAPGVIPSWLKEQGVDTVIAGGLGRKARAAFEGHGIEVVIGAGPEAPRDIVSAYLKGTLVTGENMCDH
jgi:Mrp family chromosome partitioning ATPase/predicted Fe-Mo cluster-binding NifX family protein